MANPYARLDQYNHQWIDMEALGRDLAPLLGAEIELSDGGGKYCMVRLHVPGGLALYLRSLYGAKWDKIEVNAGGDIERKLDHCARPRFPSATVSTARPVDAIAKDIKRRVIEPSTPVLDELQGKVAERDDAARHLAEAAAKLVAAFPENLDANIESDALTARLFGRGGGTYLDATLHPDGSVRLGHVGSLPASKARRVLAILLERED